MFFVVDSTLISTDAIRRLGNKYLVLSNFLLRLRLADQKEVFYKKQIEIATKLTRLFNLSFLTFSNY